MLARKLNNYQMIALAIAAGLALIFTYIFFLSVPTREVAFDNMTLIVKAHDYEALRFEVPAEFGTESLEARFEVFNEFQNGTGLVDVYVMNDLTRFECEKQILASG